MAWDPVVSLAMDRFLTRAKESQASKSGSTKREKGEISQSSCSGLENAKSKDSPPKRMGSLTLNKRRRSDGSHKFRQGTLADCRKVVVLSDVTSLQEAVTKRYASCLRLHAKKPLESSGSTTRSDDGDETPHGLCDSSKATKPNIVATEEVDEPARDNNKSYELASEQTALSIALGDFKEIFISWETLRKTGVGKTVNKVARADIEIVGSQAQSCALELVKHWRETAQSAVARTAEKKRNGPVKLRRV